MNWTTSCPDWVDRLKSGRSIIPPPIFKEAADEALSVFKQLRIVDAPGSPTYGEACADWVFDLVASIFGAYNHDTGERLIVEWFVLIPKKNSKSTLAAGIMMTALILNWRRSAEFSIVGPTVEVANNAFGPANDMTLADDDLKALMHVQTNIKTITNRESGAKLKVIAADTGSVGGKKAVGTLIDELWIFGKRHDAENMIREATGGLASRPEGFVLYLTTQSDEPPAGVFKQKLKYARDVRDGKIHDPKFVPVIYEFPDEMIEAKAYLDPKNFAMVNPNLGRSVSQEFLEREFTKAKSTGDESLRGFLSKYLNVEIGLALRSDRWAGAEFWEQQGQFGRLTLDDIIRRSDVIEIGIDGGGLDDLLGLSIVGRDKQTGEWLAWFHAWAHPSVLRKRAEVAPAITGFAEDGDVTLVERVGDDVDAVADICEKIYHAELLDKIGVDPVGIGAILDELESRGIPAGTIVGVSQGWKLGGAIKTTERKLAEGSLIHGGSALMNWCVGNARIEQRANSILVTKQVSGSAKIDPLMALFSAVTLMSLNPAPQTKKFQMFVLGAPETEGVL